MRADYLLSIITFITHCLYTHFHKWIYIEILTQTHSVGHSYLDFNCFIFEALDAE